MKRKGSMVLQTFILEHKYTVQRLHLTHEHTFTPAAALHTPALHNEEINFVA